MKLAILIWDSLPIFKCYLTKRQVNFKIKRIIWEHEVKSVWEHILYTFCFENVEEESWWKRGDTIVFPCLSCSTSQIASVSPTIAGSSAWCSQREAWVQSLLLKCPWAGKGDVHYLSRSEICRAAFSLSGRSLSLSLESGTAFSAQLPSISTGVWGRTGLVNKVVMHYRRRRLTSETFGFPKCLVWWAEVAEAVRQTAVWPYSAILQASCSLPSQGGEKSKNRHHHREKKYVSCLASVKFMGINRMMLLHRWWINKLDLTWPQTFGILMYFLIL